jgi:hypothetical protein
MSLFPVFACEGQQGDVTGAFDGGSHLTLVLCTIASLAARTNFSIVRDKALEKVCFFIIDGLLFIRAELAELWARVKAA